MGGEQLMKTQVNSISIWIVVICLAILIGSPGASAGIIASIRGGFYSPAGWSDSHDVIYDGSGAFILGAEIGYTFNFPLEIALAYDTLSEDGTRVWPDDQGGWESANESVSYDLRPITAVARWRFLREQTISPYLGAGFGFVKFEETEGKSESGAGFVLQGGGDWYITKLVKLYMEVEWTSFPDVIGEAGVSRYYGEDDVGGIIGRIGVRFTF